MNGCRQVYEPRTRGSLLATMLAPFPNVSVLHCSLCHGFPTGRCSLRISMRLSGQAMRIIACHSYHNCAFKNEIVSQSKTSAVQGCDRRTISKAQISVCASVPNRGAPTENEAERAKRLFAGSVHD